MSESGNSVSPYTITEDVLEGQQVILIPSHTHTNTVLKFLLTLHVCAALTHGFQSNGVHEVEPQHHQSLNHMVPPTNTKVGMSRGFPRE